MEKFFVDRLYHKYFGRRVFVKCYYSLRDSMLFTTMNKFDWIGLSSVFIKWSLCLCIHSDSYEFSFQFSLIVFMILELVESILCPLLLNICSATLDLWTSLFLTASECSSNLFQMFWLSDLHRPSHILCNKFYIFRT